jgi:hypothetical protein
MSFRLIYRGIVFVGMLLLAAAAGNAGQAPTATGSLRGQVTDPSGAAVVSATVLVTTPSGAATTATTNRDGVFEVTGLAPGKYGVKVIAPGFTTYENPGIDVAAGPAQKLNIAMSIEVQEQKVEVTDTTTKIDVNPENNAGAIVMQGKDLEALSDDPDELQSELQALAGPSAGPNGGQIYIDGFTAGQLPPKASIREIRINQNPFSAEYDKLGYGRIEILTKPGTDQFHGQFFLTGNTAGFNSRNPFEDLPEGTEPPGYHTTQFSANVGGPLSKKASFFFNIERRDIIDLSVVSAQIVNPTTFAIEPFSDAVANPKTRLNLSPRLDYQVTASNTLSVRYQYWRNVETGDSVGSFNLASLATNSTNVENTLQVTDTQTLSPTTINETRFQYIHESDNGTPLTTTPEISVPGSFVSGGNTSGINTDTQSRYELTNITYINKGKHALKIGGRMRNTIDNSASNSTFNGAYSFGTRVNLNAPGCDVPSPPTTCTISGIEAYQITLQALASGNTPANMAMAIAEGGGASFYSLNYNTIGTAAARVNYFDAGLFAQDDFKFRPNITVSYGLRYETQNNLGGHADFAPRIGIAWGIDGNGKNKSAKTILRLGYGIFYDRFTENLVLQQQLQNGFIQQQFLIQNPTFFQPNEIVTPTNPLFPPTAASTQAIYVQNPNLRAPYTMQTGVTLERQLSKMANLSVTYLNSRGNHQLYSNFINAPEVLPGQPVPPPPSQIQYAYQSEGVFKQNQLIVNSSLRIPAPHGPIKDLSIFGYYTLNYANSDTSGANFFPSIPSDPSADYGRAAFDIRQRIFFGGTIGVPYGFRLSPFLIASSGIPFNITTGQDIYGDAQFNARPSFGTCGAGAPTGDIQTAFGCFNALPQPGATPIPINYANGPGRFVFNLRLSKTFGFGQKKEAVASGGPGGGTFGRGPGGPGGGGHGGGGGGGPMFGGGGSSNNRYNLTFSVSARNLFNNVNFGTPIGNLSSPLFGEANSLAGQPYASSTANRRIDLQVQFTF